VQSGSLTTTERRMSNDPAETKTLVSHLRLNLQRMLDEKGGSRREAARALDMYPSQLSRLLNTDAGWAALVRLEERLVVAGYEPMQMLGPVPAMLQLASALTPSESYQLGRLLMLVNQMDPSSREQWLKLWVDASELALRGGKVNNDL